MSRRTVLMVSFVVALTAFSLGILAAYLAAASNLLVGLVALNLAATAGLAFIFHRRTQFLGAQVKQLIQLQKTQVTKHSRGTRDILSRLADSEKLHAKIVERLVSSETLDRDMLSRLADSEKLHLEIVERLAESERRYVGSFEVERLRAEDRHLELLSLQGNQSD